MPSLHACLLKLLKMNPSLENLDSLAQKLLKRLESLDSDFKTQHLAVVDSLQEGSDFDREQDILNQHDDEVLDLSGAIDRCLSTDKNTLN